ncbi:hypothetical protein [Snuella sedimenti]|uniref:Uncharacterized protein n=1 Tax=Snuella sedimenti TaxID=2798802 RepID=A0A8J7IHE0_9FLAO|nr:hypothetical protein [Snuella sedimenti]MBJ6367906.1 hypothetical protein [Snuella sedimenti]
MPKKENEFRKAKKKKNLKLPSFPKEGNEFREAEERGVHNSSLLSQREVPVS